MRAGGTVTVAVAVAVTVVVAVAVAQPPRVAIPAHNSARLTAPAPFPAVGDAAERGRRLFDAIVHDDPARAMDFFFPRDAFEVLKGISNPGRYHDRLVAEYHRDIHALHATTRDLGRATFDRFQLSRRRTWQTVRSEGNALPYWAVRHNFIAYRVGEQERRIAVRTVISWDDRWYVTHLAERR
jgi:hypothetical protein